MKEEDGVNSGARNIGRFFLFAIPAILGVAFLIWFAAYMGVVEYIHELSQQKRAAIYVGVKEPPKEKLKINVERHDCTEIVSVDVNGNDLVMYAKMDVIKDWITWLGIGK